MNLNCQPEKKLLGSNWLPGMLPLLLWPKKLLLGIGIGVGYKLSHNGVGKNEFEDLNWSNGIQRREWDGQTVPGFVRGDNWLWRVEWGKLRKICQILNWFFEWFLTPLGRVISCDWPSSLHIWLVWGAIIIIKVEHCRWSFGSGSTHIRFHDWSVLYHCRWW